MHDLGSSGGYNDCVHSVLGLALDRLLEGALLTIICYPEICDIDPRYGNALVHNGQTDPPEYQTWYVSSLNTYKAPIVLTLSWLDALEGLFPDVSLQS